MITSLLKKIFFYSGTVALLAFSQQGFAQTYCTPTDDCSSDDYIQSFSTTGGTTNITNNNTGCTGNGYNYYPTMIHTGIPGGTVNFSFTNTPDWSEYYKIWVDWNNDGDFADAGEQMYASATAISSSSVVTGSFTIPAAATTGNKRMRIRCAYGETALDPCLASWIDCGETEDYILNVASSACSGTPTGGTTNAAATTINCGSTTSLSLTGSTSGSGISYQWQYNTIGNWVNFGTNAATQTTPAVIQATQFRCHITCSNSGSSSNSTPVTVNVNPTTVALGNDTTICPGVSYTFNAGNAGAGASYEWNTGAITQSITVSTAGTYSVLVTLANGCQGSDAVIVSPGIVPVNNLPATTDLCSGETATLNAGNTGSTYLWTPGGATTQLLNVTTAGTYSVKIRSTDGCQINSPTNVVIRPLPVASLAGDTSICDGAVIVLNAGNPGYTYLWNTGATTQTVNASDSGMYTVTITTPYNCTLTDEQHVAYLPSPRVEGFNFVPLFYENLGKVQFSPLNPTHVNGYEWDFGDGSQHSLLMNPQHIYTAGGDYNVVLKVSNDCGDYEIGLPINVDIVTGIVKLSKDVADVRLYPNPARDYIILDNRSSNIRMEQVTVINILGATVYNQKADNAGQHRLQVAQLAPGIYTLRVLTDKGFVIRRFEVQR